MAIEKRGEVLTGLALTTGLAAKRFVMISSTKAPSGNNPYLKYATLGADAIGVLVTGSTGSTQDFQAVSVQVSGIARVTAASSTLSYGDTVSASSVGKAKNTTGIAVKVGTVWVGSSGSTRVISVLLRRPGTTAG